MDDWEKGYGDRRKGDRRKGDRRKGDRRKSSGRRIEDFLENDSTEELINRIKTDNAELRLIYNFIHNLKDKLTGNYE